MKIINIFLCTVFMLVSLNISTGYAYSDAGERHDRIVRQLQPFLAKLALNNAAVLNKAESLIQNCPYGDKDCWVYKIYRYIVQNYHYRYASQTGYYFQSALYTMDDTRHGDCVDLTLLLISLLHSLDIKTFFVLTTDHAYTLGCGLHPKRIMDYMQASKNVIFGKAKIHYYEIDNQKCLVLESTAFKYGYPGTNPAVMGGVGIDPVTHEIVDLRNLPYLHETYNKTGIASVATVEGVSQPYRNQRKKKFYEGSETKTQERLNRVIDIYMRVLNEMDE